MKTTHHLPARLVRWTSLCVCFVLVLSCFVVTPLANFDHNRTALAKGQSNSQNGNVKKVEPAPPVTGPPAGNWPNLDEVKVRPPEDPRAPDSVNSTLRSRRKPIESRRGRTVGDPAPRPKHISSVGAINGSGPENRPELASSGIQNSYQTDGKGGNLLALSAGSSVLKLIRYPAFHLYDHPALAFLHYALRFDQAIAESTLSLSLSSPSDLASESAAKSLLSPLPEGNGYTYSRSIAINHAKVPNSNQTNFPVLISGTYSYLATVANGGRVQNSNGYDIIFTSDSGCATKLSHEVETYNASTGAVNYWVKVPTLSHTSDTTIFMCYGNSSITTDQSNKTAVWDANFKGVWHLPNGTSLTANDSSSNGVNGTVASTGAATGQIDGGGSFDGSTSKIDMGNASALDGMTALTISVWIKPNSLTGANRILTKWLGSFLVGTKLGAGDVLRLAVQKTGGGLSIFDSPASTLTTGNWQHCVLTWSQPNTVTMYVNGTAKSLTIIQDQNVTSTGASSTAVQIGYSSDGLGNHFDGLLDEVRMSNVVRSADWSKTEYYNQSSPSTFYTISAVSGNQPPVANTGGPYSGTSLTAVSFNGNSSSDSDGNITNYSWNFGDPNSGSNNSSSLATPTHTYATAGPYIVTLTVTDNLGATNSASTTVPISNRPPVANAGGPYTGITGTGVQLSGSGSDPDGNVVSYSWAFGDGNSGSGATTTHTYTGPGTYSVTLTVTDDLGAQASSSSTATIAATADYYTQNFIQYALARPPSSDEVNYWTDIYRAAYAHGQGSMILALREMGKTIFESADYAARSRSDHDYVRDLYKTFLLREPDSSGWAAWEALVPSIGRDQVRRGFDGSTEFQNLVPTLTTSGTPSSAVSSLASARIDPFNQPGSGLLARDAEWSVPLLSLPGRAGLDLGLSLSYSSAVWTRSGPYVYFDEDNGSPSPGFRLGFPTIQEKFFDAQAGANIYLLIAAGRRVELRQVGTSNVYEAADSSSLQLIYNGSLLVRTTDGTQLSYSWFDHEYRCIEIKDRNGNYITVNYDWRGDITTFTDTLQRLITFNYDNNANLISITQNGRTQPWATFFWDNLPMQPSMSGAVGTYNSEVIPVLTMVSSADGTYSKFTYNGSGQVTRITHYASDSNPATDNHEDAHTVFNYAAADDATRLSNTHLAAENWTGVNGVPAEVVTQYGTEGDAHTLSVVGDPNGTVYKEFYGTGWQRGLPVQSQVWAGGALQKTTTTQWTQDNINVNYQTNPRMTETNVIDSAGNHSRTTIAYNTFTLPSGASCSLPNQVDEYEANATAVARRTHTDYNLDANYVNVRLIGLPQAKFLYEGTSTLKTKSTYAYDWGGEYLQNLPAASTQHDGGYSTDYVVGRGNLVDILRWDVNDPNNSTKALESKMGYDINGSVVFARDPLNHQTTISYGDAFSASGTALDATRSFATFAYPTTITDADGYSSSLWYRYDFGAKTRAQGPPPANQPNGIIQTFSYDDAARIQQVTTTNTGAYTHYVYGPNYVQSYSTVNTVAANFLQADSYAIQLIDGAGRVIGAANNHPGSSGGFRLVNTIYDLMGRAVKVSNPGEINNSWVPVGDEAAGLIYTQQTYDWKGRPLVTTNTDGTQKYASYTACGCAGSEVMTLTDEVGRQQKVYNDVLGRTAKTEILQTVNNITSVYSTTVNTFNARDQVTQVRQYQGADTSGVYQDTSMGYDGYGRLQTKHVPEQNAGTATTYAYNADDTVYSITDARGASATYGYNNRYSVTGITYSAPAGITPTSNVSFAYDAVGKRISMTDGFGIKSYSYNQLSQLISETRTFNSVGTFSLNYDYNLAGELKKITDPTNMTINYAYDSVGRLSGVTGSDTLYANVSNYASNFQYRAWGGLKTMTDGKGYVSSVLYNSRLQPSHFEISGNTVTQNYDYYNDGRISVVHNTTDQNFDRSYTYDHVGRLTEAKSGANVNGYQYGAIPYYETFGYDGFSNLTARESQSWNGQTDDFDSAVYSNNRRNGWGYDADGRNTTINNRTNTFDAAGQQTLMTAQQVLWNGNHVSVSQTGGYDGDGARIQDVSSNVTTYYLRSSVLGGAIVEEVDNSGQKNSGYVCSPGGQLLATQRRGSPNTVTWKHNTPAGTAEYTAFSYNNLTGRTEFDPLGADLSLSAPPDPPPSEDAGDIGSTHFGGIMDARWSDFFNLDSGFTENGFSISTSEAMFYVNFGTGNRLTDSVSSKGVADALGVAFAGPGASRVSFGSPGVEGMPGHQTIEWQWVKYDGEWAFAPIPAAYSGIPGIQLNAVSLSESVHIRAAEEPRAAPLIVKDLGKHISELVAQPRCGEFISSLIAAAANGQNPAHSTDMNTLFKMVVDGKGGYYLDNRSPGGGGSHDGSIEKGDARIYISYGPWPGAYDAAARNREDKIDEYNYALVAMHETIHDSAKYGFSDRQLAEAALTVTGIKTNYPADPATANNLAWSRYWNDILRDRCPPVR